MRGATVLSNAYDKHGLTIDRVGKNWAVKCTCRSCGVQGIRSTGSSTPWPPERAAVLMKDSGWAERGGKWTCPSCIDAKRKKKDILPMTVPASNVVAHPSSPRTQTAEDKRLIRMRLEEVYDPERGMYTGALNDDKVAEEMGVPRAWVTAAREYLGEDRCEQQQISREEINRALLAIQEMNETAERLRADVAVLIDRINRETRNVASALQALK